MLHPTFEPAVMIYGSGGTPLSGLAAADLNADRKPDLLVANFFSAATPYMNGSVDVLINTIPYVQRPINSDGSSTFKASRGVIPIKFDNTPTCALAPATISLTRTAGGSLGTIDESTYENNADNGSNFRIDPTSCQYVYNLAATSLGVGVYRADISIEGITVSHAGFALK